MCLLISRRQRPPSKNNVNVNQTGYLQMQDVGLHHAMNSPNLAIKEELFF